MKKKKIMYASLEMIRFLDRRGPRRTEDINNLERKTVVTRSGYIDFLASQLEKFDPKAKRAHAMAGSYRNKS